MKCCNQEVSTLFCGHCGRQVGPSHPDLLELVLHLDKEAAQLDSEEEKKKRGKWVAAILAVDGPVDPESETPSKD